MADSSRWWPFFLPAAGRKSLRKPALLPLDQETRPTVGTTAAAHYLNLLPRTLHHWAMESYKSPIKPIRVNGRLHWPVAELRRLLGVA